VGCNTHVHGSNARNLAVQHFLISNLQKYYVFLIISCVFSSTKWENKRTEQVLPGSRGRVTLGGGVGGMGKVTQIMHTHVSKCKNNKRKTESISTC
jgi:hypothetical protein